MLYCWIFIKCVLLLKDFRILSPFGWIYMSLLEYLFVSVASWIILFEVGCLFLCWLYIYTYIYISHIIFLKYIYFNTFVLLEVDFNVYFHSLLTKMAFDVILYSPWSTGSFETHLFGFYCQRITKVCFNSSSMDNDYYSAVSVYVYGQRITP